MLNFFIFPYFGSIDISSKIYISILFISIIFFVYLIPYREIIYSNFALFYIFVILIIFFFSFFSYYPFWAFISTSVLFYAVSAMFITVHFSVKDNDLFGHFASVFMLFGVVVASLGVYEFVHFALLGPSRAMLIPYLMPPDSSIRVGGIYGQPNLLAVTMSVTILCFLYWYLHKEKKIPNKITGILQYVPFLLVCYVFFLTQSKGGLLSLSLTLLLLAWLLIVKYDLRTDRAQLKRLALLFGLVFFAYALYRVSFIFLSDDVRALSVADKGTSVRFLLWASAIFIFLDNPILGIGLDNFRFIQSTYNLKSHDFLGFIPYEAMGSTPWAHNEALQILCETGVFVFILFVLFFILFFKRFWIEVNLKNKDSELLYTHIFLFPFIFQSFFSWPLRHPSLLFVFFIILGFSLANHDIKIVVLKKSCSFFIRTVAFFSICILCFFIFFELQIGHFKRELKETTDLVSTRNKFVTLVDRPYSHYRLLRNAVPIYVRAALEAEDPSLASWILPYCEEIAALEGARWQWYNLARIYLKVGNEIDARTAIQNAIDLRPSDDTTWAFLHYLNMLKASRETGRPIEDFWPLGQEVDISKLELFGE